MVWKNLNYTIALHFTKKLHKNHFSPKLPYPNKKVIILFSHAGLKLNS